MNVEKVYPRVSTCTGPNVLRATSGVRGMHGTSPDGDTAGPVWVVNLAEQAVCE